MRIGRIDQNVRPIRKLADVPWTEFAVDDQFHVGIGVNSLYALGPDLCLSFADLFHRGKHLPIKVGEFELITVHNPKPLDPPPGQHFDDHASDSARPGNGHGLFAGCVEHVVRIRILVRSDNPATNSRSFFGNVAIRLVSFLLAPIQILTKGFIV